MPRVGLFVTCLVDLFRPSIGFASVRLLEQAGCEVVVPPGQTCCGQPAWNAGDRDSARAIALGCLDAFAAADLDAVVAPSGSCIGMLRQFPAVLGGTDPRQAEAESLAARAFELTEYLVDHCGYSAHAAASPTAAAARGPVTYHDSCAGLRECGIRDQPRALLAAAGVELIEMDAAETCCGFGGTFCIKYPDISRGMVDDKLASIDRAVGGPAVGGPAMEGRSDAPTVVGGDLGCLLNIAGRLTRTGRPIHARHVAEILAGDDAVPAIGEPEQPGQPEQRSGTVARTQSRTQSR